MHIVLYQPEIPGNTGNIGRLCVGSGSTLHIIKPCRFLLTDKEIKRAGLDYWPKLKLQMHDSLEELYTQHPESRRFYCTTKCSKNYTDMEYRVGDMFVFGPESSGLPQTILNEHPQSCITIPMHPDIRSFNLSNSVAIILYEAIRQIKLA
ncbi:MAG TPA: tRNA (cytidine(34)-2'-O)-methyltransferase [Candidatus Cloacimonetes bacterium]|nr:tRNA (uridine(34)/cytosine(34)/5-carboxymethylaminomethyluridine(34)-2'-O)-methyltransferase TrmL [Candidatus Cloacimonas sp.]HHZ14558.1 tRNA (cytidine(34)-2'-O)-methyltransferase [Candidatus Cloacimonadota bacterium]